MIVIETIDFASVRSTSHPLRKTGKTRLQEECELKNNKLKKKTKKKKIRSPWPIGKMGASDA